MLRPSSIILPANSSRTVALLVSTSKTTPPSIYTITVTATNQTLSQSVQVNVQVLPPPDIPPTAIFTFKPSSPVVGQDVVFNGTGSFDPDGFVRLWTWNFGDGSGLYISTTPFMDHTFFNPGNYSVLLTVQDNAGLTGSKSQTVNVMPRPMHDVSLLGIFVGSSTAVASQRVFITIYLRDDGTNGENVSVTVYANGLAVQTIGGLFIQPCGGNCFYFLDVVWDTTSVAPGQYTISATIFLPKGETDPTPQDNSFTDGTVTILPAPVIVTVPASGAVGAKIVVEGSGFPQPNNLFGPPYDIIAITFDDMNLGFVVTTNGAFNFTLDVPLAQPGPHSIKALDEIFGAHTTVSFQVLPNPASVVVTVNTGAVYFPGDVATIYVLTILNGGPASSNSLQLQLMLVYPNGNLTSLKTVFVSPGLYRATFAIPKAGSLGTYSLVATAQTPGPTSGTALGGFEVQPSWLSSHSSTIAGGTAVAGVFGFADFAWHKGYFRRKNDDEPQPEAQRGAEN
jgi:PKD repeat protein